MYIGEISPDNKVLTAGDPIVAGGISTEATTARRYLVGVASVSGANQETNTNAGVYVTNGTLYAQQYSGLPVFTYNSLVGGVAGVVPGFSLAQNIDVANSYLRADGTFAPVTVSSAITSVPAAQSNITGGFRLGQQGVNVSGTWTYATEIALKRNDDATTPYAYTKIPIYPGSTSLNADGFTYPTAGLVPYKSGFNTSSYFLNGVGNWAKAATVSDHTLIIL